MIKQIIGHLIDISSEDKSKLNEPAMSFKKKKFAQFIQITTQQDIQESVWLLLII